MLQFGSEILSIDHKGEEKKIRIHHFKSIVLFKTTKTKQKQNKNIIWYLIVKELKNRNNS